MTGGKERWLQRGADTIGSVIGATPIGRVFRGGGGASAAAAARREPVLRQPSRGTRDTRQSERMPDVIDPETGEILRRGRIRRTK